MESHRSKLTCLVISLLAVMMIGCRETPPPTVESTDPPYLEQGAEGSEVTIRGSGFEPDARVRMLVGGTDENGGVTVRSTRFVDAETLVTTVDVAHDAATGVFDVEVEAGGRTGKGVAVFGVVSSDQRSVDADAVEDDA